MADGPGAYFSVRRLVGVVAGCGLLAATGLSVARPQPALASGPVPSAGQVQAAQNQASQRAAALGKQNAQVAAANAQLTDLDNQAEILTEDYDRAVVAQQLAQKAYIAAVNKLAGAEDAERTSRRAVGALAANEYETQGGFDPMAAMLGDAHGVTAYLNQMGLGQVFTSRRTDILARNNADSVVARVFRTQASTALKQRRAAAQQAAKLKVAIQAAVAQQQSVVQQSKSVASQLSSRLNSAKHHANHLANERAQALAAEASTGSVTSASEFNGSAASSSQGNIAANFAISQIGKPYQWGAIGPSTYDCSGLAMIAWQHAGVSILHYTGDQWAEGEHVSLNDLQRGDLVFYATNNSDPNTIHHVGIYIGGGNMVDAPYTGVDVRIDSIYQPGVPIGAVRP